MTKTLAHICRLGRAWLNLVPGGKAFYAKYPTIGPCQSDMHFRMTQRSANAGAAGQTVASGRLSRPRGGSRAAFNSTYSRQAPGFVMVKGDQSYAPIMQAQGEFLASWHPLGRLEPFGGGAPFCLASFIYFLVFWIAPSPSLQSSG